MTAAKVADEQEMKPAFFTDCSGQRWDMRVDWAAMRRSAAAGVDLSKVEEYLGDFYRGSVSLVDAVWAVISPEAERMRVDRETFERRVSGEVLEQMIEALRGGLTNFFPSRRGELIELADAEIRRELTDLLIRFAKPSTDSEEN